MNKVATVKKNTESIRIVKEHGIEVKTYFMVNFPGETEQTVQDTLDFAEKTKPDKWLLSSFAPLPGSDVWDHPEHYGITSVSRNWTDYYLVGKGGIFQPSFETMYLTHQKQVELHDMMYQGLKEILG
jgi:p-methyltransferase